MAEIDTLARFGKLNQVAYLALQSAAVECKTEGYPVVEVVHWFHRLLDLDDSDLHGIIRTFQLDAGRIAAGVSGMLSELPRGATRISGFSPDLERAIEQAWLYATLRFKES